MHPLRRLSSVLTVLALVLSAAAPGLARGTHNLFVIQRSKNANEIHYDARVSASGALQAKDPIDAYWLRKAEDGSRAPITALQEAVYGYDVEPAANGTYTMRLTAFEGRPLTLVRVNGRWRARTTIAGKKAYLRRLYIVTDESGVVPKVLRIDVFGEEVRTGKALTEHLVMR